MHARRRRGRGVADVVHIGGVEADAAPIGQDPLAQAAGAAARGHEHRLAQFTADDGEGARRATVVVQLRAL